MLENRKKLCSTYHISNVHNSIIPNSPGFVVPFMQHIITQDFARNQDPPPVSSPASATFQSVVPPVSSSGRAKVSSRYSPENQVQALHLQRPSSRVSPENAPEKPRARYRDQTINLDITGVTLNYYASCVKHWCLSFLSRPGKSPDRGGRPVENYEPISPPQSYQGMDKQEAGGPPPQRRDPDTSEIRYWFCTVWTNDSLKLSAQQTSTSLNTA